MNKLLAIIGTLLIGLVNQQAIACSCVGESTVEGGFRNADIVASGQVISTTTEWFPDSTRIREMVKLGFPADSLDKRLHGYYLKKVQILIETLYKGKVASHTLTIYTGIGGGDCGFHFEEGQKYIIYSEADSYFGNFFKGKKFPNGQDVYWTNICTRTQEHNRTEIKELERIKN